MILFCALLSLCVSPLWASLPEGILKPVPVRDIGPRIVNGEEAQDGQFPWQVAIMGRSPNIGRYLCGGSLISEQWVLTAGHCVEGATSATIYSGSVMMMGTNSTATQATEFYLHEGYDPTTLNNDIGLIKLETELTLDENTKAIALAEEELLPNSDVTISGWGQVSDDDPNPYAQVLNYITVATISNSLCSAYFGSAVVYPGLVCTDTGNPLKSPCLGDSGGPVVADLDTSPVQVGVFSFVNGLGCEYPYPAGNSRTAYHREWIRNITGI